MKFLLFLIVFLQMNAFAQRDNRTRIEFLADQDSFPDCRTLFHANGRYAIPNKELIEIVLPNTIPVNPSELASNDLLIFHSFSEEARKLGSVEFDEVQIIPYTYDEVRELILASEDSTYWRVRIRDENYLRKTFGIVFDRYSDPVKIKYPDSNGVIDGVYLNDVTYLRFQNLDDVQIAADFYHRSYLKGRIYLQPKLDSIFQPFYFSNYEVTNGEYREFVRWVADSIELHMAYSNSPAKHALLLLDCTKKERKSIDSLQKQENLDRFGLTRKNQEKINGANWAKATTEMYYPQPTRYYRRKELNERRLIYKKSASEMIATYPDTSGFYADHLGEGMAFVGRLTWHAFYANYPVTNVSYEQIEAYCHWKQRRLNEEFKSEGYKITVRLPTITEYEFALKTAIGPSSYHLAFDQKNDHFISFNRPPSQEKEALFYTAVHYNPSDKVKSKLLTSYEFMLNYKQWYQANQSESPVKFLNGNVSEFVLDQVTPELWKHYRIDQTYPTTNAHFVLGSNYHTDIKTYGDDQYNAIFYKTALENGKSSPLIGFRLVYLVEKLYPSN